MQAHQPRHAVRVQHRGGGGDDHPGAHRERQEQLQAGDVEGQRGDRQQAVEPVGPEQLAHSLDQVGQAAVRHLDALRPPGRAGGVEDIGGRLPIGRRQSGRPMLRQLVHRQDGDARLLEAVGAVPHRQHADRRRVGHHHRQPVRRSVRVERQVGGAGAQDPEQGDRDQLRAQQRHRDQVAGADVLRGQDPGQQQAALVQLGIGQRALEVAVEHHRDRVRRRRRLPREQFRHRRHRRGVGGVVPVPRQVPALGLVQQVDVAQADLRLPRHGLDQPAQPPVVRLQFRAGVEPRVGVEVDAQAGAVGAVVDEDGQVLDLRVRQVVRRRPHPVEGELVVERLDVDGEPGELLVVVQQAEVASQVLVAVLLVPQGLAHRPGHLDEQRVGGGVLRHRQADRHGVGHHARDATHGAAHPRRHRQPEHEVLGAGHLEVVGGDQGDQRLRQADVHAAGPLAQPEHRGLRQQRGGAEQAAGRRGEAAGQGDRLRSIRHLRLPVGAVPGVALGAAIGGLALGQGAQRTVAVRRRRPALAQRAVELGDPLHHHAAGKAVEGDVVRPVVPDPVVLRQLQHRADPGRAAGEVERRRELVGHPAHRRSAGIRPVAHVEQRDRVVEGRQHHLERDAGAADDAGAYGLHLLRHLAQRLAQQVRVDDAVQLDRLGDVGDGTGRRDLLADPHASLRGGKRKRCGVGHAVLVGRRFGSIGASCFGSDIPWHDRARGRFPDRPVERPGAF